MLSQAFSNGTYPTKGEEGPADPYNYTCIFLFVKANVCIAIFVPPPGSRAEMNAILPPFAGRSCRRAENIPMQKFQLSILAVERRLSCRLI